MSVTLLPSLAYVSSSATEIAMTGVTAVAPLPPPVAPVTIWCAESVVRLRPFAPPIAALSPT